LAEEIEQIKNNTLDSGCEGKYTRPTGEAVMKLKLIVFALFAGLFAISTAEARGPLGLISVGNWKGGAFTMTRPAASRIASRARATIAASISWS
jgi:hypothetical protein